MRRGQARGRLPGSDRRHAAAMAGGVPEGVRVGRAPGTRAAGHRGVTHAMGRAADRWREALGRWAIPPEILEAAPESPWTFPVELFASRTDAAVERPTPSNLRALEAVPEGGSVLDVGCGAGAASMPLAGRASRLVGVDTSEGMLEEFARR